MLTGGWSPTQGHTLEFTGFAGRFAAVPARTGQGGDAKAWALDLPVGRSAGFPPTAGPDLQEVDCDTRRPDPE